MSFTAFPRLPYELRRTIWNEACCVTRVLDLRIEPFRTEDILVAFFYEYDDAPATVRTWCRIAPPILHASQESRSVGLKHYQPDFDYNFTIPGSDTKLSFTAKAKIYVNWDYDIICPFDAHRDSGDGFARHALMLRRLLHCDKLSRIAFDVEDFQLLREEIEELASRSSIIELSLFSAALGEPFIPNFRRSKPTAFELIGIGTEEDIEELLERFDTGQPAQNLFNVVKDLNDRITTRRMTTPLPDSRPGAIFKPRILAPYQHWDLVWMNMLGRKIRGLK
ncbi:uncharacterized protein LY89DRAFT_228232 [Mollisia scopiformis]|uniref:2EXR domain-containing protein n=1 Tax=Mollisia scopiformis TaxID=149040 RepID=A0A194WUG7_MOLSC|nr:uncharacterized protein LY89DRAFT_228232 [Mollisia scopiformis]KUJ11603.1 hypothetical protein LY89DRAFT_228232 [Mollisia scopiformis]